MTLKPAPYLILMWLAYFVVSAEKLPTFGDLGSIENKAYDIEGCALNVSRSQCLITLRPSLSQCKGKISLQFLLDHFFPNNELAERTNTLLLPDKFDLEVAEINKCHGEAQFISTAREKVELIPRHFILSDTVMLLALNYKSSALEWLNLDLNINGTLQLQQRDKVSINFHKSRKEDHLFTNFTLPNIRVSEFTQLFTETKPDRLETAEMRAIARGTLTGYVDEPEDVAQETGSQAGQVKILIRRGVTRRFSVPSDVTSVEMVNPEISGFLNAAGTFEFVARGKQNGGSFNATQAVVVQKVEKAATSIATITKYENALPMDLLRQVTGKEVYSIQFLSSKNVTTFLTISNNDIHIIKHEALARELSAFISKGRIVARKAHLVFRIPLREALGKEKSDDRLKSVPKNLNVDIKITKHNIVVGFPAGWNADLDVVLPALNSALLKEVPEWLRLNDSLQVKALHFILGYENKDFEGYFVYTAPIKLGNLLTLKDMGLSVTKKGPLDTWNLSMNVSQTIIDGIRMEAGVNKLGVPYVLEAKTDPLTMEQLLRWFDVKSDYNDFLATFYYLNFLIENNSLYGYSKGKDLQLRMTGSVSLFDWKGLDMEALIFFHEEKTNLIFGLVLKNVRLRDLMKRFFDKVIIGVDWINRVNIGIILSTSTATNETMAFQHSELKEMKRGLGFRFRAVFPMPDDCKSDMICRLAKQIQRHASGSIQDAAKNMIMEGTMDEEGLTLKAAFPGRWNLSSLIEITATSLVAKVGEENGIWFDVKVNIKSPQLTFEGKILVSTIGRLELQAKLGSTWEQPLGISLLAFENTNFQLPLGLSAKQQRAKLEGTLSLGVGTKNQNLKADVVAYFSPGNSSDMNFHAQIDTISLQSLAKAMDFSVDMPQVLSDINFPNGLVASYPTHESDSCNLTASSRNEQGFALTGVVNIFGRQVKGKIDFHDKDFFVLSVTFPPLLLSNGGFLLTRSKENSDEGPTFIGKVENHASAAQLEGYATVFGISAPAIIHISDDGYIFGIDGNMFNVVEANLTIKAKYDAVNNADFKVIAYLDKEIPTLHSTLQSKLEDAIMLAESAVQRANTTILNINDMDKSAAREQENMEREIKLHHKRLTEKAEEYEAAKDFFKLRCLDECQNVCLGGVDWNPKCIELNGQFIGCPAWNDCKYRVLDEKCFAKCKGTSAFGAMKASVKQSGLKALLQIRKGMVKLYRIGRKYYNATQKLLGSAKDLVAKVNVAIKPALLVTKKMEGMKLRAQNVIEIRSFCLDTPLTETARDKCPMLNVTAVMYEDIDLRVLVKGCINADFYSSLAESVLDKVSPGIAAMKAELIKLHSPFAALIADKQRAEAILKESRKAAREEDEDNSGQEEVEQEVGKKWKLWKEEEQYFTELANEMLPRHTVIEGRYVRLLEQSSPSAAVLSDEPIAVPILQSTSSSRRSREENWKRQDINHGDSCWQVQQTVKAYRDLSSRLRVLVNSYRSEADLFHASKRRRMTELDDLESVFRSECVYNGCNKMELEGILYFVHRARQGNLKWAKVVETRLAEQDQSSLDIWRKSFDEAIRLAEQKSISDYIGNLRNDGLDASKRMRIPPMEYHLFMANLDTAAKTLHDILAGEDHMRITDVDLRLVTMEGYLASLFTPQGDCVKYS